MNRFPENNIIGLIGEAHRHELGESIGPDLRLSELLNVSGTPALGDVSLGYASAEGDPRLRKILADGHGVSPKNVVITIGGVHALFLIAFILCDRGDEAL